MVKDLLVESRVLRLVRVLLLHEPLVLCNLIRCVLKVAFIFRG